MQFLVGCDDNLALIDCGRWLAAEGDSVIADNVDAHGWVSCLRRRNADGDHTHALVAEQSQSFPDNLVALLGHSRAWNCSTQKRAIRAVGVGLLILECAAENVRYLGQSGEHILPASFTA